MSIFVHRVRLGAAALAAAPSGIVVLSLFFPSDAHGQAASTSWGEVLDQEVEWYRTPEAVRIADNVLLYQHENGGWPKNIDMAQALGDADRARIQDEKARSGTTLSQTTLDNDATTTQMRYLARVHEATRIARFCQGFLRGVDYLLAAQYENGGWPQYYPVRPGYYEHITFNDAAMIHAMRLLRDVALAERPYTFVDPERRSRAGEAAAKGLELILETQVEVDGRRTVWCAQYHRFELSCARARTYEPPSLSGAESVDIVRYLMEIETPGWDVVRAVQSAVAWFEHAKLTGIAVVDRPDPSLPGGFDRVVIADETAPARWARFYEIGTNRPIFVGRDGIVRYALAEIEHERRTGYRWLGTWAKELLDEEYPAWQEKWRSTSWTPRSSAGDGNARSQA